MKAECQGARLTLNSGFQRGLVRQSGKMRTACRTTEGPEMAHHRRPVPFGVPCDRTPAFSSLSLSTRAWERGTDREDKGEYYVPPERLDKEQTKHGLIKNDIQSQRPFFNIQKIQSS